MTRSLIIISMLLMVSFSFAQDWQWERYEGTFWHQPESITTFEIPGILELMTVADFDGNGRDDLVTLSYRGFLRPDGTWDYGVFGDGVAFYEEQEPKGLGALDLTGDDRSDLIVYSRDTNTGQRIVEAYQLTEIDSSDGDWLQWTHCDSLLDSLDYPGFPHYSVFLDFNGNGLLNGATYDGEQIAVYERSQNGEWQQLWTDTPNFWNDRFIAVLDLDLDGDDEIGFVGDGIDCLCYFGFYYSDIGDSYFIDLYGYDGHPIALWGGDFDGDNHDEAIVHNDNDEFLYMAELVPDAGVYEVIVPMNLYPSNTLFVGSDEYNGVHRIYSYHNQRAFTFNPMTLSRASRPLYWNDSCWTAGPAYFSNGHVLEGNQSDIDGDGLVDRLVKGHYGIPGIPINNYEQATVHFGDASAPFITPFAENDDTTFVNPRIGDVEGDGSGEIVVLIAEGAPAGIYFYELTGEPSERELVFQPHLSENLPANITEFTLGDIDNDSQAELIAKVGGGWRAYFRRNGHWVFYPNILPEGIGSGINLIDFNNDGNLDVISQNGVWISLSPSPASESFTFSPSAFTLSSYPNPFNPTATICFELPYPAQVSLDIFNINGQNVESLFDQPLTAGTHSVDFYGSALPSGVYFARLQNGEHVKTHKLLLMK